MDRDLSYLVDILDAAKLALQYIHGKTQHEFTTDIQLQDSVIRRLEIIGEASRRLSPDIKDKYSQISWFKIIGLRNVMIHEYDSVDLQVIWDTVKKDLPDLISKLEPVINQP